MLKSTVQIGSERDHMTFVVQPRGNDLKHMNQGDRRGIPTITREEVA